MNSKYGKIIEFLGSQRVILKEPLAKYSSFKIGGEADIFYKAKTVDELKKAVNLAKKLEIPVFVIGGGTNLLISDLGFRGLVVKNESSGLKIAAVVGKKINSLSRLAKDTQVIYVEADSGVAVNRLVRFTIDQGLGGMEMFLGQPGSVGGAVYINAHNVNKGTFIADLVEKAKLLDTFGQEKEVPVSYFQFGYDESIIQHTGETVLSVVFKLYKGKKDELWNKAQQSLEYRRKSQPYGTFTSGCTFRNISKKDAVRISTPNLTCSAGYLIDAVGLKGYSIKEASFSPSHANFIINSKHAKASDVLKLINLAKSKVLAKFGVKLKEEIILVGDFSYE